jgi:F-type H+-transporting ATPase subunit delta
MVNVSLSRRYARALLSLALEQNSLEQVQAQLSALATLMEGTPELRDVLANPSYSRAERARVLEAVLAKQGGTLSPALANVLRLLNDRNKLSIVPDLARAFRDMADAQAGRVRGRVTSAAPLTPDTVAQLTRHLANLTQREVVLETRVDPALIGGVAAQVGSVLYDGSLRTQLEEMRRQLASR